MLNMNGRFRDPLLDDCYGYTVYGHFSPSHKWYFGITKVSPTKRWGRNGSRYKSSPRFYSAIKKYGWNNIYHHIVGTGFTKEEACALEKELIKQYNTLGEGGYNCTAGGDGLHEHKFSPEQIERMRVSHLGQRSARSRPVWCVETGQMFESCAEAGRAIGINGLNIAKAARGEHNTCGGYHWCYIGEEPKNLDSKPHKTAVHCIEDNIYYDSLADAAKAMGVTRTAIRYAAKERDRTCCGKHWMFVDHT